MAQKMSRRWVRHLGCDGRQHGAIAVEERSVIDRVTLALLWQTPDAARERVYVTVHLREGLDAEALAARTLAKARQLPATKKPRTSQHVA
jgi:hypothetical protein